MAQPQINSATTEAGAAGEQLTSEQLLAGKYPNEKELERGYLNQMSETNKIIAQRDALKRQLDVLIPLVQTGGSSGGQSAGSAENSPLVAIAESAGVTPEQLVEAMREVAQGEIRPLVAGLGARQAVARQHPDFVKFEGEVHQFLAANPEVADVARRIGDPEAAIEYSYLKWKDGNVVVASKPNTQSAAEQVTARLDAQLSGGGGRSMTTTQSQVDSLLARARETGARGDWNNYLAATLGDDNGR